MNSREEIQPLLDYLTGAADWNEACSSLTTLPSEEDAPRHADEAARFRSYLSVLTALVEERERLRKALEPFAAHADNYREPDDHIPTNHCYGPGCPNPTTVTLGDFRRARSTLNPESDNG